MSSDTDMDDVLSFVKGDVSSLISLFIQRVTVRAERKFKIIQSRLFLFKVKLDYLALLDVSSRYFEVPYSLCRFFGGGVRRVFGNSFGQRHAGGFKGLGDRSPVLSTGTTS